MNDFEKVKEACAKVCDVERRLLADGMRKQRELSNEQGVNIFYNKGLVVDKLSKAIRALTPEQCGVGGEDAGEALYNSIGSACIARILNARANCRPQGDILLRLEAIIRERDELYAAPASSPESLKALEEFRQAFIKIQIEAEGMRTWTGMEWKYQNFHAKRIHDIASSVLAENQPGQLHGEPLYEHLEAPPQPLVSSEKDGMVRVPDRNAVGYAAFNRMRDDALEAEGMALRAIVDCLTDDQWASLVRAIAAAPKEAVEKEKL